MKSSWKIARVAGIELYVHATFFILLGWVALSHFLIGHGWRDAVSGLVFVLAVFTIVVLHEFGHALTAKKFGIRTRDITLYPIGGVARLERIPENPKQELLVALAGPAVNFALALVLLAILLTSVQSVSFPKLVGGDFLSKLLWVNVTLAVFNLLPAFPMDGGRVLRALLAIRMDYGKATVIAANIGQAMAWLFGLVGLFTNPFLVFIGIFVWLGAAQEAATVEMKSALAGVTVSQVMIKEFRILHPHDRLSQAVAHIMAGCQQDFPVLEHGRVVGILTRSDLLNGLTKYGELAPVSEAMQQRFQTAAPSEMAEAVLGRLQAQQCHTIPVIEDHRVMGIVTMDNLGEFLTVQAAMRRQRRLAKPVLSPA